MTELSFARSFLSSLNSRSIKLQPDHVADPKTLEVKGPYTLPRMPHPMRHPATSQPPGLSPTIIILLKSLRNPPISLSLSSQSLSTSIHELKSAVVKEIGTEASGTENIRVLYKKKPCPDSKTVKEVLGDEDVGKEIEFSIMVMGGATASQSGPTRDEAKGPVAQGASGDEVLGSEEFWDDLKGFLVQRIRDEGKAVEVWETFRKGWITQTV